LTEHIVIKTTTKRWKTTYNWKLDKQLPGAKGKLKRLDVWNRKMKMDQALNIDTGKQHLYIQQID